MVSWMKDWNDIIRYVFFSDWELKKLMMIPDGTNIITFINNYFVRSQFTSTLLTNENVRILYYDSQGQNTDNPNVRKKIMTFDIFVKNEHAHDVGEDRLMMRSQLIAERLMYLLTKDRYINKSGYRFWIAGDWDLGSRTSGYTRYCVSFYYMKVY